MKIIRCDGCGADATPKTVVEFASIDLGDFGTIDLCKACLIKWARLAFEHKLTAWPQNAGEPPGSTPTPKEAPGPTDSNKVDPAQSLVASRPGIDCPEGWIQLSYSNREGQRETYPFANMEEAQHHVDNVHRYMPEGTTYCIVNNQGHTTGQLMPRKTSPS